MKMMTRGLLAAIGTIAGIAAFAAPIAVDQATKAVGTWASARPAAHMTARLGAAVAGADTVKGPDGQALFHVVRLEGGGYVVTSADDRIEPIIAFSEDADLVRDEGNPLWKLLNLDLPQRRAAVESVGQTVAHAQANGNAVSASVQALSTKAAEATDAWADLLSDDATAPAAKGTGSAAYGRSSIPDVRVEPLVETRWNQSNDESNTPCYNLETPNGYVCGCVATAGAQLMRKHCHPTESVQAKTFSCWVDGVVSSKEMIGGTYVWANMPARPGYSQTTEIQRKAIAKLCYDVGVATRMNWGRGGSGAVPAVLAQSFVDVFKYANAKCHMDRDITETQFRGAIYANLDAGYPVLLGIYGNGGHEIVADGYGYYGSRKKAPFDGIIEGQALHSRQMTLVHPVTGEEMTFTAPMPKDMEDLISAIRERAEQK